MSQQDEIMRLRIENSELTERVRVAELELVAARSNVADLMNALGDISQRATEAVNS